MNKITTSNLFLTLRDELSPTGREVPRVPGRPIKSTDPRKREIAAAFKGHLNVSKVTMVAEKAPAADPAAAARLSLPADTLFTKFYAHALTSGRDGYSSAGVWELTIPTAEVV